MWQAQNKRRSIVKRGLKKNQVMIAALAVMIAAAGYRSGRSVCFCLWFRDVAA